MSAQVKPTAEQAIEANRINLAFDLAYVLWDAGGAENITDEQWRLAVMATNRALRVPSEETKALTLRILASMDHAASPYAIQLSEPSSKVGADHETRTNSSTGRRINIRPSKT
jgi:hypothetical protein